MAARANWKGDLKLSLVSCPIAGGGPRRDVIGPPNGSPGRVGTRSQAENSQARSVDDAG
jgi:hypothetical protein